MPFRLRLHSAKRVGRATAFVLAVAPKSSSRMHGPGWAEIGMQDHRLFIDTDQCEGSLEFDHPAHVFPPVLLTVTTNNATSNPKLFSDRPDIRGHSLPPVLLRPLRLLIKTECERQGK